MNRVPEGWKIVAQGDVAHFYNGRAYKLTEWERAGTPVIRLQNLTGSGNEYYYSSLKLPEKQYCTQGDLLYMWSASFGPYIWDGPKAIYHYHIWKIECNKKSLDKNFMFFLLDDITTGMKNKTSGSTMLHVTKAGMEKHEILLPPLAEQKKIAEILGSVDRSIEATEKLIAKLSDLKKALMQQLFTKGIGHTEFKDSPLGKIPTDWEVVLGSNVLKLGAGISPSNVVFTDNGDTLYIKVDDFNSPGNEYYIKSSKLHFNHTKNLKIKCFPPGTIVIAKRGAAIFQNRIRQLIKSTALDTNLMTIQCEKDINDSFLKYFLEYFRLDKLADTTSIPQINNFHLNDLCIPSPSIEEQKQIASILLANDAKIEKAKSRLNRLQDMKKGLMQDLLTGKVRVNVAG